MGQRLTQANENQRRHPRAGGGPRPEELDSRLRGNDVVGAIFKRAGGDEESRTALRTLRARLCASLGMTAWVAHTCRRPLPACRRPFEVRHSTGAYIATNGVAT